MTRKMLTFFLIALLVPMCNALSADWKYYGGTKEKNGDEMYLFFDSESIKISNNNINVWIKAVLSKDIEKTLNNKNNKIVIDKAARKLADGYIAPYSLITKEIDYKGNLNIIAFEEAANYSSTKVRLKTYYEIDCTENKIRTLSLTLFNKGGVTKSSNIKMEWDFIAPESNGESLEKIVCEHIKSK
jgi:hypothetical protein